MGPASTLMLAGSQAGGSESHLLAAVWLQWHSDPSPPTALRHRAGMGCPLHLWALLEGWAEVRGHAEDSLLPSILGQAHPVHPHPCGGPQGLAPTAGTGIFPSCSAPLASTWSDTFKKEMKSLPLSFSADKAAVKATAAVSGGMGVWGLWEQWVIAWAGRVFCADAQEMQNVLPLVRTRHI